MDRKQIQDDWLEHLSPDELLKVHLVAIRYESECRKENRILDPGSFYKGQAKLKEVMCLELVCLQDELAREFRLASLVDELLNGRHLDGRYVFLDEAGTGSHGRVFQARDLRLNRTVAIKIPKRSLSAKADQDAILKEAQYSCRLRHPNIVSVHAVEEFGEQLLIVSEYIEGETLQDCLLALRTAGPAAAVRIVRKLADALQHAHHLTVIHRDVKPGNIIIDERDEPQLTDFGIATSVELMAENRLAGTRPYMAPEQLIQGVLGNEKSDQYALGIILYELVVGERPQLQAEADAYTRVRSIANRDLESICRRSTHQDANQRYQSCSDLREDLVRWEREVEVIARKRSSIEKICRFVSRYRVASLLLALLLLSSVFATFFGIAERHQRKLATVAQDESARNAYANSMALALNSIEAGDAGSALVELTKQIPISGLDQRGPEWDMLWNRANSTGQQLFGHREPVTSVDFSPDGQYLASASEDGVVRIWRPETGKCTVSFQPFDFVWGIRFLPNSDHLIINDAVTVEVRSTVDWSVKKRLSGFPGTAKALGVSPDGSRFAIASNGGSIRVWNSRFELEYQRELEGFHDARGLAFSPDGSHLALSGKKDLEKSAALVVWNLETDELKSMVGHERLVHSVKFGDSNTLLSASWDGTVRKWDLATGENSVISEQTGIVRTVEVCDSDVVVSGGESGVLRVWTENSASLLESARVGMIQAIAFSPKSRLIAVGGFGNYASEANARGVGSNLSLWRLDQKQISRLHEPSIQPSASFPKWIRNMKIGSNGDYAIAYLDGPLIVYHTNGTESRIEDQIDGKRGGVDIGSTSKQVVYSTLTRLRLLSLMLQSVELVKEVSLNNSLSDPIFVQSDSRICAVRNSAVEVRDARSLEVLKTFVDAKRPRIAAIDDGSAILIGDDAGVVRRWDLKSDPECVVETGIPIESLAHANGNLAIAFRTGDVSLFNEKTSTLTPIDEISSATSIGLSQDGNRLAVTASGVVQLFETLSGNQVFRATVGTGEGRFVGFDQSANCLVSAYREYPGEYQTHLYRFSTQRNDIVDDCYLLLSQDWTSVAKQQALAKACLDECRRQPESNFARLGLLALQLGGSLAGKERNELANSLLSFDSEQLAGQPLKFEVDLANAISTSRVGNPNDARSFLRSLERSLQKCEHWTTDGKTKLQVAIGNLRENLPPEPAYP